MELTTLGFDVVLMNNFYAYPAFRNRFGVPGPNGTYQIPAKWQAGLGNGSAVGQFIGLLLNGVGLTPFLRQTWLIHRSSLRDTDTEKS
jgi:hypothetical protein